MTTPEAGSYDLLVLEHIGRSCGHAHHTPVGVLAMEGIDAVSTYLSVVQAPSALRAFGLPDALSREQVAEAMPRMIIFRLTAAGRPTVATDDPRTAEREN